MSMDRYERLILCEYLAKHCDVQLAWLNVRTFLEYSTDIEIETDLSQLVV